MLEQNDEWAISCRYMSLESLAPCQRQSHDQAARRGRDLGLQLVRCCKTLSSCRSTRISASNRRRDLKQLYSSRTKSRPIAIINRNHVLIRLPPPFRRMEFSEATPVSRCATERRLCVPKT
jgi:hypothetical protein